MDDFPSKMANRNIWPRLEVLSCRIWVALISYDGLCISLIGISWHLFPRMGQHNVHRLAGCTGG